MQLKVLSLNMTAGDLARNIAMISNSKNCTEWDDMIDDLSKRGRGRPKVYGKRQNFSFRVTEETRQRLIESATRAGRSLSEEIEFRLGRDFGWEATQNDIEEIKRRAVAWEDASRVK